MREKLERTLKRKTEYIEALPDVFRNGVQKATNYLEKRIIGQVAELKKTGKIDDEPLFLSNTLVKLTEQLRDYFGIVHEFSDEYTKAAEFLKKQWGSLGFDDTFTKRDRAVVKSLQNYMVSDLELLGRDTIINITSELYKSILGGQPFNELIGGVQKYLTGNFAKHAYQIAHDGLMEFWATFEHEQAKQFNLNTYLYYGNIIKTSRPWCILCAGKAFNDKQIRKWPKLRMENAKWAQGMKPGNPYIVRGGYNCRHHFQPIKKKWLPEGQIAVQNYYKENGISPDVPEPKKKFWISALALPKKKHIEQKKLTKQERFERSVNEIQNTILEITKQRYEYCFCLDDNGGVILQKGDEERSISFSEEDLKKIHRARIFIHNHPGGVSFSLADIMMAVQEDFGEIQAIAKGYYYYMKRPELGWPGMMRLQNIYEKHEIAVYNEFEKLMEQGKAQFDKIMKIHFHEVWRRVSREIGAEYGRKKR